MPVLCAEWRVLVMGGLVEGTGIVGLVEGAGIVG